MINGTLKDCHEILCAITCERRRRAGLQPLCAPARAAEAAATTAESPTRLAYARRVGLQLLAWAASEPRAEGPSWCGRDPSVARRGLSSGIVLRGALSGSHRLVILLPKPTIPIPVP